MPMLRVVRNPPEGTAAAKTPKSGRGRRWAAPPLDVRPADWLERGGPGPNPARTCGTPPPASGSRRLADDRSGVARSQLRRDHRALPAQPGGLRRPLSVAAARRLRRARRDAGGECGVTLGGRTCAPRTRRKAPGRVSAGQGPYSPCRRPPPRVTWHQSPGFPTPRKAGHTTGPCGTRGGSRQAPRPALRCAIVIANMILTHQDQRVCGVTTPVTGPRPPARAGTRQKEDECLFEQAAAARRRWPPPPSPS